MLYSPTLVLLLDATSRCVCQRRAASVASSLPCQPHRSIQKAAACAPRAQVVLSRHNLCRADLLLVASCSSGSSARHRCSPRRACPRRRGTTWITRTVTERAPMCAATRPTGAAVDSSVTSTACVTGDLHAASSSCDQSASRSAALWTEAYSRTTSTTSVPAPAWRTWNGSGSAGGSGGTCTA